MFSALLFTTLAISSPQVPEVQPIAVEKPLPSDCLYAIMLIQCEGDTEKEPVPHKDQWKDVSEAIQHIAVKWQIMDPRECRYFMSNRDDFHGDLQILRTRYHQFKDIPRIEEIAGRFPDKDTINKCIQFNRAFRKHLETRMLWESDRADLFRAVIAETDYAYKAWSLMCEIKGDLFYVTYRREALKKYMDLVKQKKPWDSGEIPDYVPSWRFQQR